MIGKEEIKKLFDFDKYYEDEEIGVELFDDSYNIDIAQLFIENNFENKYSVFGKTNFKITKETYKDRYVNLQYFNQSQDYYKKYLNLNTNSYGSSYLTGAKDGVTDVTKAVIIIQ